MLASSGCIADNRNYRGSRKGWGRGAEAQPRIWNMAQPWRMKPTEQRMHGGTCDVNQNVANECV
eukprot:3469042-Alexandrium_andersonii.AAC.1